MNKPQPICGVCARKPPTSELRECSHVDCPNRSHVTAQAPDGRTTNGAVAPKHYGNELESIYG